MKILTKQRRFLSFKRGFTLVELLVVISIIGLLSSVILAALSSARVKGTNGRIQEEVVSFRNGIELGLTGSTYTNLIGSHATGASTVQIADEGSFSTSMATVENDILLLNGGKYGGGVPTPPNNAVCNLNNYYMEQSSPSGQANGGLAIYVDKQCTSSSPLGPYATKYAIFAAYKPVGSGGYFCLDSSGQSVIKTSGMIPYAPGANTTCI